MSRFQKYIVCGVFYILYWWYWAKRGQNGPKSKIGCVSPFLKSLSKKFSTIYITTPERGPNPMPPFSRFTLLHNIRNVAAATSTTSDVDISVGTVEGYWLMRQHNLLALFHLVYSMLYPMLTNLCVWGYCFMLCTTRFMLRILCYVMCGLLKIISAQGFSRLHSPCAL